MTNARLATVGDAINALSNYDPATPLRIAHYYRLPTGPQHLYVDQHIIEQVVCVPEDSAVPAGSLTVWFGLGEQTGPLPASAVDALGWSL